jgi:hypothetical protein
MSILSKPKIRICAGAVAASSLLAAASACSSSLEPEGTPTASENPLLGEDGMNTGNGLVTGNGDDPNGFEACVGQTVGAEIAPTVLQLIVDTSGSMDDDAPGPVRGSKWQATRRALLQAIDKMPASTAVGVVFYPDLASNDTTTRTGLAWIAKWTCRSDPSTGPAHSTGNGSATLFRIKIHAAAHPRTTPIFLESRSFKQRRCRDLASPS